MSVPDRGDVRRDVEVIRGIVEDFDALPDAELNRLYKTFCGYIEDVNAELEVCEELIDANDEMQAVQRAERAQLLEVFASLEAVDREGWDEFLDGKGLKAPPPLRLGSAERLNQCFGPVKQREPLMRELRWHALAGSPLRARLGVMHRIRESDDKPEIWEPDIEEFEKARIYEIEHELDEACAEQDAARLGNLCRELTSKAWLIRPARETVQRAKREYQKCEARHARKRFPQLLEELRNAEAGGENQIDAGRRLMHQLEICMQKARFSDDAEEHELAAEAVEWVLDINEREQHEADYDFLTGDMEQLMDQFAGMKKRSQRQDARDRLKQIEYKLRNYDDGVPEAARVRLNSIYDAVEREERWAQAYRLTGVVCLVAAVGTLLWFGLQYRSHVNMLAGHVERIGTLVEREDFPATEGYIEKLQEQAPEVLDHPPVAALISQHKENASREQRRLANLMSGIRRIRDEVEEATSLAKIESLGGEIDQLETTCRFENELNDVDAVRTRLTAAQIKIQESIDEQFSADLEDLNDRYQQADSKDGAALNALLTEYRDLGRRPDVSDNLKTPLSAVEGRLLSRISLLTEMQKQSQQLESITRTVGDWPTFQAALEQFTKTFPSSARGLQFQRLLDEEAAIWGKIQQQNEFLAAWKEYDLKAVSPQKAAEYATAAEQFLTANPGFTAEESLKAQVRYLKSIAARRNSAGERIVDPLLEVLRDPSVTGLFMLMTKEGKRYYSDAAPKSISGNGWVIRQFDDSTLTSKTTKTYYVDGLAMPPKEGTGFNWTAPQTLFAREASTALTQIGDDNWEETMLELLDILLDDERMDPIIQFQLLDNLLPIALEGSIILQDVLRRPAESLASARLGTNLNLFDPGDIDTEKARGAATRFLDTMPDMGEILRGVAKTRADMTAPVPASEWVWGAWIYKDDETQKWTCAAPKQAPAISKDISIAIKRQPSFEFVTIGTLKDRKYSFSGASASAELLEGRPVFYQK